MKNNIKLITFFIIIIFLIILIFSGINIANIQVLSVAQLKQKNEELNEKIMTASELTSVDYPEAIDVLEETYEKAVLQKQKYEEMVGFAGEDNKQIFETKQYDIGYLWKIVEKYATSHNLTIGMDVRKGTEANLYDLYFTVSGQYVNTSQFIAGLENNSDLAFRIYNFKMSGTSEVISSSFTVKDINIDPSTLIQSQTSSVTTQTSNEVKTK